MGNYISQKEYWGAASTRNCVWLFQMREDADDSWHTLAVFLRPTEAYQWGIKEQGMRRKTYGIIWRTWGCPSYGDLPEKIGHLGNAMYEDYDRLIELMSDAESNHE